MSAPVDAMMPRKLCRSRTKTPHELAWDKLVQAEPKTILFRRYDPDTDYVVGKRGLSPPEALEENWKVAQSGWKAGKDHRAEFLQRGRALSEEHALDSPVCARACPPAHVTLHQRMQ